MKCGTLPWYVGVRQCLTLYNTLQSFIMQWCLTIVDNCCQQLTTVLCILWKCWLVSFSWKWLKTTKEWKPFPSHINQWGVEFHWNCLFDSAPKKSLFGLRDITDCAITCHWCKRSIWSALAKKNDGMRSNSWSALHYWDRWTWVIMITVCHLESEWFEVTKA